MRVTLKTVNEKLAGLGTKAELAKGAGYFLFRGGEADDWIDRTVAVQTIGSLTPEQWLNEYKRLKTLNGDMIKASKHVPARPAKTQKKHHEAPTEPAQSHAAPPRRARTHEAPPQEGPRRQAPMQAPRAGEAPTHATPTHPVPPEAPPPREAPPREPPPHDSARKEACSLKTKLLAELDQAHKALADIEAQELRAAREGRISDLVTLSVAATKGRSKFDRALLSIRDHTLVHGC